ncbi:phosphatidylserine decarboxylase [Benzoatithermus flavus]|uniref:Phosphatidylserine decarboxylase proenzyme n=1 Tax=Benzoatithermus flavus TaxID=3108223 RepID=A0ABU8XXP3_9PROT
MSAPGTLSSVLPPIHRAGWPFIAAFLVAAILLGLLWAPLFWLGLLATLWCAYFFRDPVRVTPDDPALVVSPADGVVVTTAERVPPPELELGDRPLPCIGIFMNVFDVHVNRTPVIGTVVRRAYHPGKFLNASFDKASDENERQSWKIRTASGREIGLVQIAGLVARRIVPFVGEGAVLAAGQRVGLIRFGSRCDVYLPEGVEPLVLVGQRALAGETVLADLFGNQPKRQGRAS